MWPMPLCLRFLIRIEEGYGNHPYHSRTHAADVLRRWVGWGLRRGCVGDCARVWPETFSAFL